MSAAPREFVLPLTPREQREAHDQLPTAEAMQQAQYAEAVDLLTQDTSGYPVFPWPSVARMAGPMVPDDLVMIAARTGGGKSLFLQNLFDALVTAGRTGLYVGLEQAPRVLRIKWACLRAGVDQRLVLAPQDDERERPERAAALSAVADQLRWQQGRELRERAHFAATRFIDAKGLRQWVAWAVDHGCDFVVLDHIDRVHHGDGRNAFHEMSTTVRTAKELAAEHHLVMLVASQVGRPGDAAEAFQPPALHNLRGGGTKEEESDTVLGVFRPLKEDVGAKEIAAVRNGLAKLATIVEPKQMGVRILKHRLDGSVVGEVARLRVEHGRLYDLPERDWHTTTYPAMRNF